MFAHANFEGEFRSLQGAITNDPKFGERRANHWNARRRPDCMAKLIKKHFPDGLEEAEQITSVLTEAIDLCDRRNLLAHGEWWTSINRHRLSQFAAALNGEMKNQNMRTSQPRTSVRLPRSSRSLKPSYTISAAASRPASHVLADPETAREAAMAAFAKSWRNE
jgi:hypothetical protein